MIETFLMSSGVSAILTAGVRIWQQKSQDQHDMQIAMLRAGMEEIKDRADARTKDDGWSKKVIALIVVLTWAFTIVFPGIAASFGLGSEMTYMYYEWKSGFLFFSDGKDTLKHITVSGVHWTDLDSAVLGNVIGYLFGGSVARRR